MKKIFIRTTALLTILISILILPAYSQNTVKLDKGTFVLVYSKKTLSSETMQEGDRVYFISPADVWVNETNIVPENSVFVGYVSMLKMPIKGINAAFSIKITHIILPNGETKNFSGRISNGKSDILGGELAPPASYNKMAHPYQSRWHWSGTTQWVPSGEYEYGRHRGITPGQKLFIVLDEPYYCPERF